MFGYKTVETARSGTHAAKHAPTIITTKARYSISVLQPVHWVSSDI